MLLVSRETNPLTNAFISLLTHPVANYTLWLHLANLSQVGAGVMWLEVRGGKAGLLLPAGAKDGALTSVVWDWGSAPTSN